MALASAMGCTITVEQPDLEHPTEAALAARLCPPQFLQTTPVASQCCYSSLVTNDNDGFTLFYNATTNQIVNRKRNPYGYSCRASDGISACSGSECFYGPFGFARPTFSAPPNAPDEPYWTIFIVDAGASTTCQVAGPSSLAYDQTFLDKTGINPTGQGCPGSDSSFAVWDY